MATTMRTRPGAGSRDRESGARGGGGAVDDYDLLTAALLGVLIGAGTALLLRSGPKGRRPIARVASAAGTGAVYAGRYGKRGAQWAARRGGELWDRIPFEDIGEQVGEYLESAREAIDEAVSEELADLRKAIRRRRKKLGL